MNQFPIMQINRTAGGAIAAYRWVKTGSSESLDVQAAAATDAIMGVSGSNAVAEGSRFDAGVIGIYPIEYGGNVTRGQELTSDADGKAIARTSGDQRVGGVAWEDGDAGTIGSVLVGLGSAATTIAALAASTITVADAGGKLTATNVEAALAELEARIAALEAA